MAKKFGVAQAKSFYKANRKGFSSLSRGMKRYEMGNVSMIFSSLFGSKRGSRRGKF